MLIWDISFSFKILQIGIRKDTEMYCKLYPFSLFLLQTMFFEKNYFWMLHYLQNLFIFEN